MQIQFASQNIFYLRLIESTDMQPRRQGAVWPLLCDHWAAIMRQQRLNCEKPLSQNAAAEWRETTHE